MKNIGHADFRSLEEKVMRYCLYDTSSCVLWISIISCLWRMWAGIKKFAYFLARNDWNSKTQKYIITQYFSVCWYFLLCNNNIMSAIKNVTYFTALVHCWVVTRLLDNCKRQLLMHCCFFICFFVKCTFYLLFWWFYRVVTGLVVIIYIIIMVIFLMVRPTVRVTHTRLVLLHLTLFQHKRANSHTIFPIRNSKGKEDEDEQEDDYGEVVAVIWFVYNRESTWSFLSWPWFNISICACSKGEAVQSSVKYRITGFLGKWWWASERAMMITVQKNILECTLLGYFIGTHITYFYSCGTKRCG